MKKNLFLTTVLLAGLVAPAFADDAATPDKKITGGAGTCTVDVLGVSDNNATANTIAVWSINEYTLNPGEYLNVTATSVDKTQCPAGSYCVGGNGFTVDNAATSIATCPAEYPNSATGAGAQNQCYTACTVATANIAHATAVSGNDYFDDGADACYATACDTGYHVDGDRLEFVEKDPLIPVDYTLAGSDKGYIVIYPDGGINTRKDTEYGLTASNTWACEYDYGVVYGRASCQPSMNPVHAYLMENAEAVMDGTMTIEEFKAGLEPLAGSAKTEFAADILFESGIDPIDALYTVFMAEPDANYQTTDSGQYCYCQMDGFSPMTDGVMGKKTPVASAPWVFYYDAGSANECAYRCTVACAESKRYEHEEGRAFRAAMFGAFEAQISGTCAANTINIDWNPDNGGEHTQNMCTYDGSITLPTPDPVKPGYTFTGWKLVEKTTTTE